ncbi:MAG: peptidyl-prolyl cis-trans isomerase [Candidatus Pacebacteria bacterium]|nr:peptidyl-prolyl cis-trans isomerase [Candidatus Paceibacterota bacterium]
MSNKTGFKLRLLTMTVLAGSMLASASLYAAPGDETVVAKANNNITVTYGEVKKLAAMMNPNITADKLADALKSQKDVQNIATVALQRKLLVEEAKAKKIGDKADVVEKVETAKTEIYLSAVLEQAVPPSSVANPTEAEIHDVYEKNKARLKLGKRVDISWIMVRATPEDDAGLRKAQKIKIDEIANDLKTGNKSKESFAKTARLGSEDPNTRDKGGSLGGLIALDQLGSTELKTAIEAMKTGDISAPINVPAVGWYVVRLNDMKPAGTASYEDVKDELSNKIKEEKLAAARQTYVDTVIRNQKGNVDEAAIAKLVQ